MNGAESTGDGLRQLCRLTQGSEALSRLKDLGHSVTGSSFFFLLRTTQDLVACHPRGDEQALPEFCRLLRCDQTGLGRCDACRTLVSIACHHGMTDHVCHGGVQVFTSPVGFLAGAPSEFVAVSSGAYRVGALREGWAEARTHVENLSVDMAAARAAYEALPTLEPGMRRVLQGILDSAAAVMLDLAGPQQILTREPVLRASGSARDEEDDLRTLLEGINTRAYRQQGDRASAGMVGLVTAAIVKNPGMHLGVADIAHAAGITPNHFSAIFHRFMGVSFVRFLAERRMKMGERLLAETTLGVEEIALRCGYRDAGYFARRFRQLNGVSPTAWRRGEDAARLPAG